MLTDIIVIDDVFDDPDSLVRMAREFDYFDNLSHPDNYSKIESFYSGLRTRRLNEIDNSLFVKLNKNIFDKIHTHSFPYTCNMKCSYRGLLFFHFLTKKDVFTDRWFHKDHNNLCAGVVYLHKNPPKNTGTIIIKEDKEIVVENKYNRLVLYNADLLHSPQNSFGDSVYDARLTLTIFYEQMTFNLQHQANCNDTGFNHN